MSKPSAFRPRMFLALALFVACGFAGAEMRPGNACDWDQLRPELLKKPLPVNLRHNPLQPARAPAQFSLVSDDGMRLLADRIAGLARTRIQGVVRRPNGASALLWSGHLVEAGGELTRLGEGAAAQRLQLKSVGAASFVVLVRARSGAEASEVAVELPPLLRLR